MQGLYDKVSTQILKCGRRNNVRRKNKDMLEEMQKRRQKLQAMHEKLQLKNDNIKESTG